MKFLTFGEIMLRLKSPGLERFFQSPMLEATFGGGEANVAVSLANFEQDAAFLTVLRKTRSRMPASVICAVSVLTSAGSFAPTKDVSAFISLRQAPISVPARSYTTVTGPRSALQNPVTSIGRKLSKASAGSTLPGSLLLSPDPRRIFPWKR